MFSPSSFIFPDPNVFYVDCREVILIKPEKRSKRKTDRRDASALAELLWGNRDRLGSITKQGSAMARFILGQLVMHVLRRDPWMKAWYGRIKRRRGAKIARVAVMRRLATIIWHTVKTRNT
jgi:transposase